MIPALPLLLCAASMSAQPGPAQPPASTSSTSAVIAEAPGLSISLTPAARYQFRAALDDSKFDVLRYGGEIAVFAPLTEKLSTAVSLRIEESRYTWKDFGRTIAGVDRPIRDGLMLTLSPTVSYEIDDRWSITVGAIVMFAAGDGADLGKSGTYGGFASAKYKFSDVFSLSAGLLASSRLEENPLVFPLIGLEWQIDQQWRIETTGLGLRGSYKASDRWTLFGDAGYEFREYRLADDVPGGLRGGVMRDNAAILAVGTQWKPSRPISLELGAGVALSGSTRFENASGDLIRKASADPAPFVALSLKWEF